MKVDLTDEEIVRALVSIDRPEIRDVWTNAVARVAEHRAHPELTAAQAGLLADVTGKAIAEGTLRVARLRLRYCTVGAHSRGWVLFKSGPRKGKPNLDRPLRMEGYDFSTAFIRVEGHTGLGGCADCVSPILPLIGEALRGKAVEVPPLVRAEGEPVRKRHAHRRCPECGWEGHEGEMVWMRTLLGDGTYPAACPACGHEAGLCGTPFETLDGFTVVEVE